MIPSAFLMTTYESLGRELHIAKKCYYIPKSALFYEYRRIYILQTPVYEAVFIRAEFM
jgi:hypothetical protein